jgi:hypothetical protein
MSELYFAHKMAHSYNGTADTALITVDLYGAHSSRPFERGITVKAFGFFHENDHTMYSFFDLEPILLKEVEMHKKFVYDILIAANHAAIWLQNFLVSMLPEACKITYDHRDEQFKKTRKLDNQNKSSTPCYQVDRVIYCGEQLETLKNMFTDVVEVLKIIKEKDRNQSSIEYEYVHGYGYLPDIKSMNASMLCAEYKAFKDNEERKKNMLRVIK